MTTAANATEASDPAAPERAIRSAADLLSYVPHTFGFWPSDSLVFLAAEGRAAGGLLRVDLPAEPTAFIAADLARYIHQALRPTRPEGIFVIVYSDEPLEPEPLDGVGPSLGDFIVRLCRRFGALGLEVEDVLYVTADQWGQVDISGGHARARRGNPLEEIRTSVLGTQFVVDGSRYGSCVDDAVDLEPAPELKPRSVARALSDLEARGADWKDWNRVHALAQSWGQLTDAPTPKGPGTPGPASGKWPSWNPKMAAKLISGLSFKQVRDAVLAQLAIGGFLADNPRDAASGARADAIMSAIGFPPGSNLRQPHGDLSDELGQAFAGGMLGQGGPGPDWERIDRGYALLLALLPHAKGNACASICTILGWVEYARGRGSLAHQRFVAAAKSGGNDDLAFMLDGLLEMGALHHWSRDRSTSWSAARSRRAAS